MILNGQKAATHLETYCTHLHELYQKRYHRPVSLTIVRIGEDPASKIYITQKKKVAQKLGFLFQEKVFSKESAPGDISKAIDKMEKSSSGIIVQLPVPPEHSPIPYLSAIPPHKDVDGLNPVYKSRFIACTPLGCLLLLKYHNLCVQGKHALVIGRSHLVGRPLAELLLSHNATVSIAHSYTRDLPLLTQQADFIFVAAGVKHLITPLHVHPKNILIDVGIHKTETGLAGDINPEVYPKVKAYSPVPGGVGPMTVGALMYNTLCAAFASEGALLPLSECFHFMQGAYK